MNIKIGVSGHFCIEVIKSNGDVVEVAPYQKNLILDQGLDNFKTSATAMDFCHVGDGSSIPESSQTALDSHVAYVVFSTKSNVGSGVPPYYTDTVTVHEFPAGTFNGQKLSEIGLGNSVAGSLFSRSLIKDGSGTPTSIIVLADEILRVAYSVRLYVPEVDSVDVIGGYTCTTRAGYANRTDYWNLSGPALTSSSFSFLTDASLGLITSPMAGSVIATQTATVSRPTARSYRQVLRLALGTANHANGISGVVQENSSFEFYLKTEISPPIMKTALDVLDISFDVTWGSI